jgi:monovalent cation/hydrogen antiporter
VRADEEKESAALRSLMGEAGKAATERLRELRREGDVDDEVAAVMERRFDHRSAQITAMVEEREDPETERLAERFDTFHRIEGEMLSAATARVLQLRASPGHDPALVDRVLAALDHRAVSRRHSA